MRTLLLAVAALGLVVGVADAEHTCPTTEPTATITAGDATFYVINDLCQPQCLFSVWIYQETNGIPGLQRCDELGASCSDCDGDTIIF